MLWERSEAFAGKVACLIGSVSLRFDHRLRSALPEAHGLYRIFDPATPAETVRAGRTKTAGGGLRQRVYQNHFMGTQKGNLRAQLVDDGTCNTLEAAKRFMREHLVVQVLVVEDRRERIWLEHFMLAVLQPRHCD